MDIRTVAAFDEPETVAQIACAYQKTFGEDPWNEGWRCPICGATYSLVEVTKPRCLTCGLERAASILLVECWPKSKIVSDFYREAAKPEAVCCIATENKNVLGFAWGYAMRVGKTTDDRLEAPGLHRLIHGKFFYLDEIGVLPDFQRRGIGKALLRHIFAGKKRILLRTMRDSQMFHLTRKMGGEVVLGISKNRVIMSINC